MRIQEWRIEEATEGKVVSIEDPKAWEVVLLRVLVEGEDTQRANPERKFLHHKMVLERKWWVI